MKKNVLIFIGIIFLAAILRLWQIGHVPISPDWDEAALGYNGYSILQTGHDEYGKLLPVVLRSFDDYKPAFYAYLTIPFIFLMGLTVEAIRLPSAIFGILTVVAVYFLIKELFKKENIALLTAFLLAISPWHIQFSRVGFEANVGLALNIFGALFFIKGFKKWQYFLLSSLFFATSIYTYQSEKAFVPLFIIVLLIIFRKKVTQIPRKIKIIVSLLFIILILPFSAYTIHNPNSLNRAKATSIFASNYNIPQRDSKRLQVDKQTNDVFGLVLDSKEVLYTKVILSSYLSHFNLNWLFVTGDLNRHHAPNMGLLYIIELPFLLIGIYMLFFGKFPLEAKQLILAWFFIAAIPASITTDVPHAVRTLNFLPTFQVFIAIGILSTLVFIKSYGKNIYYGTLVVLIAAYCFNFIYYLDQYFVQQNYYYAEDWQYGYTQLVPEVENIKNNYSQIIVSNDVPMDQSYMFFLFYSKYNPSTYQNRPSVLIDHNFDKFQFRSIHWENDKTLPNTLFVGFYKDFPSSVKPLTTINYPDGNPGMEIVAP